MPSPMKENYYILISLIAKLETSSSILFLSILFKRWKDNIRFKTCCFITNSKKIKHAIQITSLKSCLIEQRFLQINLKPLIRHKRAMNPYTLLYLI